MSTDWKTYLKTQGAVYKGEQLTDFSKAPQTLSSDIVSVLSGHSLITIDGPDRQKFLQGQISTHMTQLDTLHQSSGVACSSKGRMYTNFRIMNDGESYLLSMRSDVTETTIETLKKYAVFFKAQLTCQSEYLMLGLSGENITSKLSSIIQDTKLPENNEVIKVSNQGYLMIIPGIRTRYELWLHQRDLPQWWPVLTKELTPATENFWQLLNIESVIPEICEETIEKYTPQQLNQPSLGSVSFRKGCYTGQEIVTRMQNLGQQKSRCYRLTLPNTAQPAINTPLYNSTGKAIGEIIQSERNIETKEVELLAVIRIDAAETNNVFLSPEKNQQLQVHELPYTIDPKAELQQ